MDKEIQFDIPIVSVVYKRLDKTMQVYERIREIRPKKVYIIADGPKTQEDVEKVSEVREFIDHFIDWPCEVHRRYADKNIGLRNGIPSGLDWVFETEEKAIILEDDVVPEKVFFEYCRQMLEKYEDESQVMMISGCNMFEKEELFLEKDIAFSKFASIWGWATWKRAWTKYEQNIPKWQTERKEKAFKKFLTKNAYDSYKLIFDDLQYHWHNTWDYQWTFAMFYENAVGVVPKYNMISNIGINDLEGEHSGDSKEMEEMLKRKDKSVFENNHDFLCPDLITDNYEYDQYYQKQRFEKIPKRTLIKNAFRSRIHVICKKIIKRMEKDKAYFYEILPEKYRLTEREKVWNPGELYKEIKAEELRFSAFAYVIYKIFHINIYKGKTPDR